MKRFFTRKRLPAYFFIAVAIAFGGMKPLTFYRFQYNLGLTDAGSKFDMETMTAEAHWTYVPGIADFDFVWKYRIGDGDWVDLPTTKVSAGSAYAHVEIEMGQKIDFICYPQSVAPPVVHTNGVYHLSGVMPAMDTDPLDPDYVTPRVPIKTDTRGTITPTARPPETITTLEESHE